MNVPELGVKEESPEITHKGEETKQEEAPSTD